MSKARKPGKPKGNRKNINKNRKRIEKNIEILRKFSEQNK